MYYREDELYHYGVKGMKWGVHKAISKSAEVTSRKYKKRAEKQERTANRYKQLDKASSLNDGYYSSKARKYEADAYESRSKSRANAEISRKHKLKADRIASENAAKKQAKRERREAINSTTRKMMDEASFVSKFTYGDATYRRAAKLHVDKGLSEMDAVSTAKKEAWRNLGIAYAANLLLIANSAKIARKMM